VAKEEQVEFTDAELAAVKLYAETHHMSVETAASELFSQALAKRMRKGTHKSPASNVKKFKR